MEQYVRKVMPFTTAPCPRGLAEIDRIYRSCSFLKNMLPHCLRYRAARTIFTLTARPAHSIYDMEHDSYSRQSFLLLGGLRPAENG